MGSEAGGKSVDIVYILIETVKMNNVNPEVWLAWVLERIQDHSATRIHDLLPWAYQEMIEAQGVEGEAQDAAWLVAACRLPTVRNTGPNFLHEISPICPSFIAAPFSVGDGWWVFSIWANLHLSLFWGDRVKSFEYFDTFIRCVFVWFNLRVLS